MASSETAAGGGARETAGGGGARETAGGEGAGEGGPGAADAKATPSEPTNLIETPSSTPSSPACARAASPGTSAGPIQAIGPPVVGQGSSLAAPLRISRSLARVMAT